jgi:protein SCO1/2
MKLHRKSITLKYTFLIIFILLPILVAFFIVKDHTYFTKEKKLDPIYFEDFNDGYTLFYIGYTGCRTICTPRLEELSIIKRALIQEGINIDYVFMDLRDIPIDHSLTFAQAFDMDFRAVKITKKQKKSLMRKLNYFSEKSLVDSTEFEHTAHLYLIKKTDQEVILDTVIMQYPYNDETTLDYLKERLKNDSK